MTHFQDSGFELLHGAGFCRALPAAESAFESYCVMPGQSVLHENILHVPEFLELSMNPKVLEQAAELLGGQPTPYYSHLIVTGPGGLPPTSNWHKDNQPKKGLGVKAHFYLSDSSTDDCGPMRVAPGSWADLQPPTSEGVALYAMKGDVILTRPDLWHRSTRVATSSHTRKTVHVSYRLAD